jgi:DNA (cytosine-5)-methyltransferase 1
MARKAVPVIDLFAGPGGLGEGFSSIAEPAGARRFALRVSIEKDEIAHHTLSLRALYRAFPDGAAPDIYYDYVQGKISRQALFADSSISEEVRLALDEAKNAELGKTSPQKVDGWIREALDGADQWVLIGGPPCQAYSLAGRSRRKNVDPIGFAADERHFLYTEYLRIIRNFAPSVFVMENVKGILTSTHEGASIFKRIVKDLASPGKGLAYQIRSLVVDGDGEELEPSDFVIEAERYGIPQKRHRVILFGIRSDLAAPLHRIIVPAQAFVPVSVALAGLPPLRSRLSREPDSPEAWQAALVEAPGILKAWRSGIGPQVKDEMRRAAEAATKHASVGSHFEPRRAETGTLMPPNLRSWYLDPRLKGALQHETRAHMRSDLHRYLFASCYAKVAGWSPKLSEYPTAMLPKHENVDADDVPFADRFRVQLINRPANTIVSHISKDGHYYIHPDPEQCRSFTVREAARIQTFPDNYFFEGTRTQQYVQVGNAVPPLLARQIAQVVSEFLSGAESKTRGLRREG